MTENSQEGHSFSGEGTSLLTENSREGTSLLPKGCMDFSKEYYAVDTAAAGLPAGTEYLFSYQGKGYPVTVGENCFANLNEAAAKAASVCCPGGPVPVILFSAGKHVIEKFEFPCSLVLKGQNAGISPNLPRDGAADRTVCPEQNPGRRKNESVLAGSYWFGVMKVLREQVSEIVMDGFTAVDVRIRDQRENASDCDYRFRNMIYEGPSGHILYEFGPSENFRRRLEFKNTRLCGYDDLDYGALFVLLQAEETLFDGCVFDRSTQFPGFSNMSRTVSNASSPCGKAKITVRNSYFGHLTQAPGFSVCCKPGSTLDLQLEDTVYADASVPGEPAVCLDLTSEGCRSSFRNCLFADSRAGGRTPAVRYDSRGGEPVFTDCVFGGFGTECEASPVYETAVPDGLTVMPWQGSPADPHELSAGDFTALEQFYAGRTPSYGDLHVHSNSGGTSDGKTPIENWPAEMEKKQLDFCAIVDHRQMRGFFLPAWDEKRFIIGTEPATGIVDMNACRGGMTEIHYNMLFPDKYCLKKVLERFPEYGFTGDELTGSFGYPDFTKARFKELAEFVQSLGGIIVHPHPKTMMASDDPMDFFICEHMFLETLYKTADSHASFKNYDLWVQLLNLGKHVYASCGSDTHQEVKNDVVATFYTKEKNGRAFFDQMHTADFTCGCIGMKMMIDGRPMGSELNYREGMELTLEAGDFYRPAYRKGSVYELRIFTDRGLAYRAVFSGKETVRLALKVRPRAYYRAEVFDHTNKMRVAIGNPIWLGRQGRSLPAENS